MVSFFADKFIKNSADTKNPQVREKYGLFAGVAGIIFNVILCMAKIIAGLVSGLVSLVGDGINNLSDAGSSIITILGFKLANKNSDEDHPFGHGRIEYLAGLIVSVIILVLGIEIITDSVGKIFAPVKSEITLPILIVMGASILVKLYMFTYNVKIGKKINSSALKATAVDCISDCIATTVVTACAIFTYFTDVIIDGYVGVAMGLFIGYAGIKAFRETVNPLLGGAPDKEYVNEIENFVKSFSIVSGIHDLIIHDYGPGRKIISLHVEIDDKLSVHVMHDEIDNIEKEMYEKFSALTVIHADPIAIGDEETDMVSNALTEFVSNNYPNYSVHDVRLVKGETHSNVIFDLVVPIKSKNDNKQVVDSIKEEIKRINEKYNVVIKVETSFSGN